MRTYRYVRGLVSGLGRWFVSAFTVIALCACSTAGAGPTTQTVTTKPANGATLSHSTPNAPPLVPTTTPLAPTATPSTPTATPLASRLTPAAPGTLGWVTYRNDRAGFTVDYPAGWTVDEQAAADGSMVTTFSSDRGGGGVMIMAQSGEFAGAGSYDIPNTRCGTVTVGELTGMRCFDTLNFATSTAVSANGQTFTITALGKRADETIYNHFLSTFRLI